MRRNRMFRCLVLVLLALLSACSTVPVQPQPGNDRSGLFAELAEVEKSFAAMSVQEGMRKAFIHYFADNGYNFDSREDPIRPRLDFPKLPPQTGSPRYQLDWFPVYTEVAAAGDMGFNTGPYRVLDNRGENPTSHGYFFSVWERQSDGNWRVTVDIGTGSTVPGAEQQRLTWTAPAPSGYIASVPVENSREIDVLRQHESTFADALADNGLAKGYRMYLHGEAHLHRDGIFPITVTRDIIHYLNVSQGTLSWRPTLVKVSTSGDLGYSWGKYSSGDPKARGHYCHVWKRNAKGEWKLVADIQYPVTPAPD